MATFYRNRENQFAIGAADAASAEALNKLGAGVYDWSLSSQEETETDDFYGDSGKTMTVLEVGNDMTFTAYETKTADAAQAFVLGMLDTTERDAIFSYTPVGSSTAQVWDVTVYGIEINGGNASDRYGFKFSIHKNGDHTFA